MKAKFEVGKSYDCYSSDFGSIKVTRRTEKTVWVENEWSTWKMRVKTDDAGGEFVTDSSVPKKWREAFTYKAEWEVKD